MMIRRGRNLCPVGSTLQSAFGRLGLLGQLAQQRALLVWADAVGPQIAAATRPLRVRDGILFVATRSSAWAHELILRKAAILQSLESALGKGVLTDVRFLGRGHQQHDSPEKQAGRRPLEPTPQEWQQVDLSAGDRAALEHILEPLIDPDLRALLQRVVAHDLRIRRWKQQAGWQHCKKCGLPYPGPQEICGMCRPR